MSATSPDSRIGRLVCRGQGRFIAVASLGTLGLPAAARADHATDAAGGLWPLASLLVFALAFALVWALSEYLERGERPRSERRDPPGGHR